MVGAGVGGLTAAARLAQAGLQVLIVEKNPHPGGTAYVYTRAGFRFPMWPLGFSNMDRVGGIATAMESGRRAAEAVLQGLGPVNRIQLPGVARGEDECPS